MNDSSQPALQSALPVMVNVADVDPKPVRWLWPNRIPLAKLTLLIGGSDAGKSLVALDSAARISAGKPWPDLPHDANPPGSVRLLSAEDHLDDTTQPQLVAAGADLARSPRSTRKMTNNAEESSLATNKPRRIPLA